MQLVSLLHEIMKRLTETSKTEGEIKRQREKCAAYIKKKENREKNGNKSAAASKWWQVN